MNYEIGPITNDNRRPGMDPAHTYLIRYDASPFMGWRCCKTFTTEAEALAFASVLSNKIKA